MSTEETPPPPAPSSSTGMSPSATPALVLGILSLVLGGCFIIGLVLGIIGLAHARRGARDLELHPNYEGEGLIVAGKVCSIIGIILGSLQALFWLAYLAFFLVIVVVGAAANT